jgi:hypothetical protein
MSIPFISSDEGGGNGERGKEKVTQQMRWGEEWKGWYPYLTFLCCLKHQALFMLKEGMEEENGAFF